YTTDKGAGETIIEIENGIRTVRTTPDGTRYIEELAPDPRFGLDGAYTSRIRIETPKGRSAETRRSITADMADPGNPLTMEAWKEEVTVPGGGTYTTTYSAVERTRVRVSPAGRVTTTTLEELGRVLQLQRSGLYPTRLFYES